MDVRAERIKNERKVIGRIKDALYPGRGTKNQNYSTAYAALTYTCLNWNRLE